MSKKNIKYKYINSDISKVVNDKYYFLRTYGCQMNEHDSEEIRFYMDSLGYKETSNIKQSDVVILNTCAIRENVKDKIVGFLSISKHIKETKNPNLIIVLMGCLTEVDKEMEYFKTRHNYIDFFLGTHNIVDLPYLLQKKEAYSNSEGDDLIVYENIKYKRDSKITSYVNITYGCDNYCTYCIVPYTRGRERSRKKEDILKEVNELIKEGYKEVVLLGQNVNSYGNDFRSDYRFFNLLEEVAQTKIERIRFTTSNPWNFSDSLIEVIKKYKNIMPYVHLPLQSGSSEILSKMNRKYTSEEYKTLFKKLKKNIPNVSITTDIIVGFPGERKKEFKKTLKMVKFCKFDGAFTFIYSKRPKTLASKLEDNISLKEKENRLQKLNKLITKYSYKNNKKLLNKNEKVLVLGTSRKNENKLYGYTEGMKIVNFLGSKSDVGKIINIKITEAKSYSLNGEKVN